MPTEFVCPPNRRRKKVCSICGETKWIGQFNRRLKEVDSLSKWCKDCSKVRQKLTRLRKHGLTPEDYLKMYHDQEALCAICHKPEKRLRGGVLTALAVDHDHKTGKVRGLLCIRCNTGIAMFDDNPKLLKKAITYLRGVF